MTIEKKLSMIYNLPVIGMRRWIPEMFSAKIKAGPRTYFIDVETNERGERRLVISESRRTTGLQFERHRVVVTANHLEDFVRGLQDVLSRAGCLKRDPEPGTNRAERIKGIQARNARTPQSFSDLRQIYPKAYMPRTSEDDENLKDAFQGCREVRVLADTFQRKPGAIESRLKKLGLRD